jgi:hypothetical protein
MTRDQSESQLESIKAVLGILTVNAACVDGNPEQYRDALRRVATRLCRDFEIEESVLPDWKAF